MPNSSKASPSQTKGQAVENLVCEYLVKQGSQLLYKNFRCRMGEIDLIILHKNELAFIEVRFRSSTQFGHPAESVTFRKQQKIIRTARFFLASHPNFKNHACRFDVAAVTLRAGDYCIEWIQNAFS